MLEMLLSQGLVKINSHREALGCRDRSSKMLKKGFLPIHVLSEDFSARPRQGAILHNFHVRAKRGWLPAGEPDVFIRVHRPCICEGYAAMTV